MAEDTQEDLSMEDILSSIKDILLEDNSEQRKAEAALLEEAVTGVSPKTAAEVKPDVLEDVLTLSPSMIVEPNLSVDAKAEQPAVSAGEGADPLDLDFEQEFDSLPAAPVLDDVSAEVMIPAEEADINEEDTPLNLDDFAIDDKDDLHLEAENQSSEDVLADLNFSIPEVDVEAEPIFSPEDEASHQESFSAPTMAEDDVPSLDNLIDDATLNAILDAQPDDPEVQPAPDENFVEPTDNVYENAVVEAAQVPEIKEAEFEEATPVVEPEPVAEAAVETEVLNEPDPIYVPEETEDFKAQEPKLEAEPEVVAVMNEPQTEPEIAAPEAPASDDEAVDISAGIISNFAKMFAEQQKEKSAPVPEDKQQLTEQVMKEIELGDGSLTIEAIVRDVVTGIVEKNLSADFNFAAAASAEIANQTKAWLSANLPTIVEATVKKEIERVMAKVSS